MNGKLVAVAAICVFGGLSAEASAGSNTAQFECKGSRAKQAIRLAGTIPASIEETDLTLDFADQTARMRSPEDRLVAVSDFRQGVFHLYGNLAAGGEFSLYALPKSVTRKSDSSDMVVRFSAVLHTAPPPFASSLQGAWLSCVYRYST